MLTSVLITDGGVHSAEKWAAATAGFIVSIADSVTGEKRAASVKLEAAVIDILEKHHGVVQAGERGAISESHDRLLDPLEAEDHLAVDEVIQEIKAAVNSTAWAGAFDSDEAYNYLELTLRSHFHTNMHVERSWHADRNPSLDQAQQFREIHNLGGN